MKKNSSVLFPVYTLLCCALSLASCDKKVSSIDNEVRFDSIQINETHHLANDTNKPGCNIQIAFVFPDSADALLLSDLQNIFTEKVFGDSLLGVTPKQVVTEFVKRYINDFQQFELSESKIYPNEEEEEAVYEDETGFSCYLRLKNELTYNRNGFISFTVENVSYQGGAHSSKSINGYVIDLQTGKLVQEENFAGLNYEQNLSPVLAGKIAEANQLKNSNELENIGYYNSKEIVPNNNFTINDKGITYYFNENEIAGTMLGLTEVFIPYEEINVYLKSDNPFLRLSR